MTDDILAAHNDRLRVLDRLLPGTNMPEPGDQDVPLTCPGGVGVARLRRIDPESFTALWSALEVRSLDARVAGAHALAELLAAWESRLAVRETPGADSQVMVTWPSRDVEATPLFVRHGFAPYTVVAVRRAGRAVPDAASKATIRPLYADDVPAATRLWLDLAAWDNAFVGRVVRPAAEGIFRAALADIAEDGRWSLVAEDGGEMVGLLKLDPPDRAEWVQALSGITPMAYLGAMYLAPGHRGSMLGAAMVSQAHSALDEAGIPITALHYSTFNPLSGPFWHRCGYRPLWTQWVRRSASQ